MDDKYLETLSPGQRDSLKDVVAHLVNHTLAFYDEMYRYAQGYALDDDTTAELLGDMVVALDHARKLQYDLSHPGWRQHRADLLAAVDAVETPADRARYRTDDEEA
jgi:hypothetical protein